MDIVQVDEDLMVGVQGNALSVDDDVAVLRGQVRSRGMDESAAFHEVPGQHGQERGLKSVHHGKHRMRGF